MICQSTGTAQPSFTARMLEQYTAVGKGVLLQEDEDDIKGAAGTLFAGTWRLRFREMC